MAAAVTTQWVTLPVDGSPMEAYWAHPADCSAGPWPGVIVLMEIFGVNDHIQAVTRRLAEDGYSALAINYYHRQTRNLNLGYTEADVTQGRVYKDQTQAPALKADVSAAIDFLKQQPTVAPPDRFGLIGFCFGGHVAYLAATLPEVAATASFYGGGIASFRPGGGPPTVTDTPAIAGEMLCLFGEQDPLIPLDQTVTIEQALLQAGIPHAVVRYPEAGHGFVCNQRGDYRPDEAADAWNRVRDLFLRRLKEPPAPVSA